MEEQGKALERKLKQYSDETALLRKEVEKYHLILEEINLFYCEMNLEGQITLFNSHFCTALGYQGEEMAGLAWVSQRQYYCTQLGRRESILY